MGYLLRNYLRFKYLTSKSKIMDLLKIREVGGSKLGSLKLGYSDIVDIVFEPNVTDLDDSFKVLASWGFMDSDGRKGFIWSYKYYGEIEDCNLFSVDGDSDLLQELFGDSLDLKG